MEHTRVSPNTCPRPSRSMVDQIAVLTIQGDPQRPIHHNAGPLLALADLEEDGHPYETIWFLPEGRPVHFDISLPGCRQTGGTDASP